MPKIIIEFEKDEFDTNKNNLKDFIKFVTEECKQRGYKYELQK